MARLQKQASSLDEWCAAGAAIIQARKDRKPIWSFYDSFKCIRDAIEAEADQIELEICQRFTAEWKLPNVLSPSFRLGRKLVPSANLSSTDPLLFDRIKTVLRRQGEGKECWACGLDNDSCRQLTNISDKPSGINLAAHEFWAWDDERNVRTMVAIHFLCFDCHYLAEDDIIWMMTCVPDRYHLRRIEKFCTVNQCTPAQMMAQVRYARQLAEQRSRVSDWQVDLSPVQELINQANLRRGHPRKLPG